VPRPALEVADIFQAGGEIEGDGEEDGPGPDDDDHPLGSERGLLLAPEKPPDLAVATRRRALGNPELPEQE